MKKYLAAAAAAACLTLAPAAPAFAQPAQLPAQASHVVTQEQEPSPPSEDQDRPIDGKWGLLGLLGLAGLAPLFRRSGPRRDTGRRDTLSR
jgi:hypothetical protein